MERWRVPDAIALATALATRGDCRWCSCHPRRTIRDRFPGSYFEQRQQQLRPWVAQAERLRGKLFPYLKRLQRALTFPRSASTTDPAIDDVDLLFHMLSGRRKMVAKRSWLWTSNNLSILGVRPWTREAGCRAWALSDTSRRFAITRSTFRSCRT